MQVEEEEEEVDPEVLEQQKRLKEEMNEAVKQITDRSENDSIAYVTQQMHQTLKVYCWFSLLHIHRIRMILC